MIPLRNNILISPHTHENNLGFVEEEKLLEKATVISIGSEVQELKEGDIILYKEYDKDEIELSEEESYCFIREDAVIAKE